jgi:hypothetical protein
MNKKIMAIFASMMIALCLVGASYALWSKWLTIDAWIGTDDVDLVFSPFTSNLDPLAIPPAVSLDPKNATARWDKDVGWTTIDGVGEEIINITLHNVYPCYYNDLEIEYTNVGSVPVKMQDIIITANFTRASAMGANDGQIWIGWHNGIGSQIEPGDTAGSSLLIHVEQPAAQGTDYGFTIQILFVQWNEFDPLYHFHYP